MKVPPVLFWTFLFLAVHPYNVRDKLTIRTDQCAI
jgi:hypothetical protein